MQIQRCVHAGLTGFVIGAAIGCFSSRMGLAVTLNSGMLFGITFLAHQAIKVYSESLINSKSSRLQRMSIMPKVSLIDAFNYGMLISSIVIAHTVLGLFSPKIVLCFGVLTCLGVRRCVREAKEFAAKAKQLEKNLSKVEYGSGSSKTNAMVCQRKAITSLA